MATKEVCDTCGVESPDAAGLFKGNAWVELKVRWRDAHVFTFSGSLDGMERREYLICDDCARRILIDGLKLKAAVG